MKSSFIGGKCRTTEMSDAQKRQSPSFSNLHLHTAYSRYDYYYYYYCYLLFNEKQSTIHGALLLALAIELKLKQELIA